VSAPDAEAVSGRIDDLRERLRRAGGSGVEIVAVTKGFGVDAIEHAVRAGVRCVGENFAQELVPKVAEARRLGWSFECHFIGRLQTNKVRSLVGAVDAWQSVDRAALVHEIAARCPGARVLIQVNATGEADKGGVPLGQLDDLVGLARDRELVVEGLMTVGPTDGDPTRTQVAFRATRSAVDRLGLTVCSMGMSDDLEIAIGEGSTMVRVGTAIFGARVRRERDRPDP
jgi:hypothetical protein